MSLGNNYIISGRYRIEKELGRGGMGVVYLAYDLNLSRYVAVKILKSAVSSESAFIRFKNEIFSIVRLDHPSIIHVYDAGFDSNIYYVMQYIQGTDLAKELATKGKFDFPETLNIIYQISAALDYAHGKGFFHRDVKPGNILIDSENNAYLVDFGITTSSSLPHVTQGFVGTVEYASPEHCSGGIITGKSDQYSLAIVVYEMLTGRPPFIAEGGNSVGVAIKHINEAPPDPREFCPTISENTAKAILKALSKRPEKRFPSCNAFVSCISGMSLEYFSTGKLTPAALMAATKANSFSTSKVTAIRKTGLIPKKLDISSNDKNATRNNLNETKKNLQQLKPVLGDNSTPSGLLNSTPSGLLNPTPSGLLNSNPSEKPVLQSFGNTSRKNPFSKEPVNVSLRKDSDDNLQKPNFKRQQKIEPVNVSLRKDSNESLQQPNFERQRSKEDDDFLKSLSLNPSDISKPRIASNELNLQQPNFERQRSKEDDEFLKSLSFKSSDISNPRIASNELNLQQPNFGRQRSKEDEEFLKSLSLTPSDISKPRIVSNELNLQQPNFGRQRSKEDYDFLNSLSPISSNNAKTNLVNPNENNNLNLQQPNFERQRSKEDYDFLNSLSPISSNNAKTNLVNPNGNNNLNLQQPNFENLRSKEDDDFLRSLYPISSNNSKTNLVNPNENNNLNLQQPNFENTRSKEDGDFLNSLSPISSNNSKTNLIYQNNDLVQQPKLEQDISKEDTDFLNSLSPISSNNAKTNLVNQEEKPHGPYARERKEDEEKPRSPYVREKKEDEEKPRSPYAREKKEDEEKPRSPYARESEEPKIENNPSLDTEKHFSSDGSIEDKKNELRNKFSVAVPADFPIPNVANSSAKTTGQPIQTASGKLTLKDLKEKSRVLEEERLAVLQAAKDADAGITISPISYRTASSSIFPSQSVASQSNNQATPISDIQQNVNSNISANINSVQQPNIQQNNSATTSNATEPKKNNLTLIIILIAILILGVVAFFIFGQQNHLQEAQNAYNSGNYTQAIEHYEKAKSQTKNLTAEDIKQIDLKLLNSYFKTNNIDKSIEYSNTLKEKYPDLYNDNSELITSIYNAKAESTDDKDAQIECYEKVLELNPEDMVTAEALAGIYNDNKNYEKAEKLYLDLLSKTENKGKIYSSLASMFADQNNNKKAIEYFKQAENNGGAIDYKKYVQALKQSGQQKEALNVINKSIETNPELATEGGVLALNLADSLKDKKDVASKNKFSEYINIAKKLSQNSVDEKFNELIETGSEFITQKNYSKAINTLEYALKIKPDSGKAWYKYLSALYKSGNKDAVLNNSNKALKCNTNDSAVTTEIKKWVAQINKERQPVAQPSTSRTSTSSYNTGYSQQTNSNRGYTPPPSSYSRSSREYDNPNPTPARQRQRVTPKRNTVSIPKIPSNYFKPVKKGQQRDVQAIPSSGE